MAVMACKEIPLQNKLQFESRQCPTLSWLNKGAKHDRWHWRDASTTTGINTVNLFVQINGIND